MSILTPSALETLDYGQKNWHHVVNKNVDVVDYRLQKIERLLDIAERSMPWCLSTTTGIP